MIVVAQHPRRMLAEPVAQANVIAARKAVLIKLAAFLEVRRIAIDDVLAVYHGFEVKSGDASAGKQAAEVIYLFAKIVRRPAAIHLIRRSLIFAANRSGGFDAES